VRKIREGKKKTLSARYGKRRERGGKNRFRLSGRANRRIIVLGQKRTGPRKKGLGGREHATFSL